ncbi:hypothetical protein SARC_04965 [Sphaeroforma arctica JP610]|uniref:leucine--tRNA ligase n=1 Tax=Sphaeroforma arctica JP610 TaxID=667725 RepID=A0A0L0G1Q2_9EUKA|nr:hypothetical protein SARC_04965 [Sphaeroforma arctica JP610]KNC82751.1 hypothetical protein SARC_04965 [Sphaeroforma arctica JP610]|eukprot:XP_014156653.1 hypothetical protein SARC_04965 [Sphaeroforma arctica JP610]
MVKASCDLVSAESDSAREKRRTTVEQYVHKVANMSSTTRQAEGGSSTGLDLQLYALNPFNGKRIPVYACDYVLSDYGTGAVMGVPAHDSRDALFAQNHNLEVVPVYSGTDLGAAGSSGSIGGGDSDGRDNVGSQADGSGSEGAAEDTDSVVLVESGEFSGMPVALGRAAIAAKALDMGIGETTTQYKIRDWGVSRQRYWGAPIPIVHCKSCKAVAVPESDLPVRLPETVTLSGRGGSPLETAKDWLHTTCPKCHGPAVRDTNTMDTFVDSSWYFLRYLDPNNTEALAGAAAVKGMPVDLYIGGIEHAIMHLLYSRFVTKFLRDEGVIPNCSEPFTELLNQGMVHGRTFTHPTTGQYLKPDEVDLSDPLKPLIRESGLVPTDSFEKMSKSKYNGVDPSAASEQHGVDTLRLHMLFKAPPELVLDWDTQSIQGSRRWLVRVWGLVQELLECRILTDDGYKGSDIDIESRRMLHRTVQSVETALETHSFNSAVAKLMGFTNEIRQHRDRGMSSILLHDCIEMLAVLSYPMVPHIASEIWEVVTHRPTSAMRWPVVDHKLLATAERTVVIQINGRTKGTVTVDSNATDAQVQEAALASDVVKKQQLDMDSIRRMIVANKGGLINLVMPKKK